MEKPDRKYFHVPGLVNYEPQNGFKNCWSIITKLMDSEDAYNKI